MTSRIVLIAAALVPSMLAAQEREHRPGMSHDSSSMALHAATASSPQQPGQAAFAAIAEVVRILEADSTTDWTKVNIEALRQHLIDMDDVTMRSVVVQENVAGGARFVVTGTGRTVEAIRRMSTVHAAVLGTESTMRATVEELPSGTRVTVVAARPGDSRLEARIRALGFVGLLTTGGHHGPHHVAIASGTPPAGHAH